MKARVVHIDPGKHTGTIAYGAIEAWFSLMGTAYPVSVGDEVEAIMGKDSALKPYARLVAPLDVVYDELQANELLTGVTRKSFADLVMRAFDETEPPIGLDTPDILVVLFAHYGESEEGFVRSLRDRILVFCDSDDFPDLVHKNTEAFAQHLGIEVELPAKPDFNDVFDALRYALGANPERAFLLPMGHNESALLVRKDLVRGKLRIFTEAESKRREP